MTSYDPFHKQVGARLLGQLMGFLASIGVASLPG